MKNCFSLKDFEIEKGLDEKFNKKDFCSCDIEATLNNDNEFKFSLGVVFNGKNFFVFYTAQNMYDYIIQNKKFKKFYFHNLDFDFLFFMKECVLGDNLKVLNSGNMMLSVIKNKISFNNSLAILPMSLKKVVNTFLGVHWVDWENQKSDIFGLSDDELRVYCMRDCFLLHNALYKFFSVVEKELKIKNFLTIPSLALKSYNKNFLKYDCFKKEYVKNFFNEGYYFGGHTEKFISGKYEFNQVEYYDVNSLYPYVMSELDFPITPPIFVIPKLITVFEYVEKDFIFYGEFLIDVDCEDIRIFISQDDKRNSFLFGKRWYKCSDLSIKFLLEKGFKKNILDVKILIRYDEKQKIFKEYITKYYQYRQINPAYKIIFKLLLNSLYGKYGQKRFFDEVYINSDDMGNEDTDKIVLYGDNIVSSKIGEVAEKQKNYLRKDIAGRITEGARLLMSDMRMKIKSENVKVIYQDTDSLIVDKDISSIKSLQSLLCQKTLGKLKKENSNSLNGYIIGQKIYGLKDCINADEFIASKGVRNFGMTDAKNLSLFLGLSKMTFSEKGVIRNNNNILFYSYPKNGFYNQRFTKVKTLMKEDFFGIKIVPHYINEIRERLD